MTNSLRPQAKSSSPVPDFPAEQGGPEPGEGGGPPGSSLFRRQALEAHAAGEDFSGSPLKISPRWIGTVYPLLLIVLVSIALFTLLGSLGEYAEGTAFVLLEDGAESQPATAAAVFPGQLRPYLESGMPLRFELDGLRSSPQSLKIAQVEPGVLSVAQAGKLLDLDLAAAGELQGPLVVTYSLLSGARFEAAGRSLSYHHGLRGTARVRIGTQRILPALLPALEPLFSDDER